MDRFLQLHLLTAYPPSNLNRDDLGRPKTALLGDVPRLRISSQSLKRAWRTSNIFQDRLAGSMGVRTKRMGLDLVFRRLRELGVGAGDAAEWAHAIVGIFGKAAQLNEKQKAALEDTPVEEVDEAKVTGLLTEQLVHYGPAELKAIEALVQAMAKRRSGPKEDELSLLADSPGAVDVALFGRMLAASPRYNQEAAAQVAHAITVNRVQVEDDFFTAVDDLNPGTEDVGAGHMGEVEFGSGIFYLYLCIDRHTLVANLGGDEELASRGIAALVEAASTMAPTGKQATFASRARASYVLAETGDQQPRSLAVAFLEPVGPPKMLEGAIAALKTARANMDTVYGACWNADAELDAARGTGSLKSVIERSVG